MADGGHVIGGGKRLPRRENRGLMQDGGRRSGGWGWETADPRKGKPRAHARGQTVVTWLGVGNRHVEMHIVLIPFNKESKVQTRNRRRVTPINKNAGRGH